MSLKELFSRLAEAQADQEHLEITSSSNGKTSEELLQSTDNNEVPIEEGVSWGSTGRANPKGYCQHATFLGDRSHLSHKNGDEFTIK